MKNAENLPHDSGIYKITNLITKKSYIGQAKDIYNRYHRHHKYDYKREELDYYIYQSMRKYGIDNFKIEVVELCPIEKLDEKEVYWISFYNTYHHGYNMNEGGKNFSPKIFTKEVEEKREKTRKRNKSLQSENHPRAKLKNDEVIEIRQRYINGEKPKEIYEDYIDIYNNFDTFKNIILGNSYKDVGNIPTKKDKTLNRGKVTEQQIIELRKRYYTEKISCQKLGETYELSSSCVRDIVKGITYKNIEMPEENKKSLRRKNYKLTNDQVIEIRYLYDNNILTIPDLMKKYNIGEDSIRRCVKRLTYQNVK